MVGIRQVLGHILYSESMHYFHLSRKLKRVCSDFWLLAFGWLSLVCPASLTFTSLCWSHKRPHVYKSALLFLCSSRQAARYHSCGMHEVTILRDCLRPSLHYEMHEALLINQRSGFLRDIHGLAVGLMLSRMIWQCRRPTCHQQLTCSTNGVPPSFVSFHDWHV